MSGDETKFNPKLICIKCSTTFILPEWDNDELDMFCHECEYKERKELEWKYNQLCK